MVSGDERYRGGGGNAEGRAVQAAGNRKPEGRRRKREGRGDEVTESCKIFKICTLVCALHTYILFSDS
jgi:hypothetical protein